MEKYDSFMAESEDLGLSYGSSKFKNADKKRNPMDLIHDIFRGKSN
jgi:hypothetical protein